MGWLLVFLGGGTGAALRHGLNRATLALFGPGWPWGTMIANLAGSFALGLLAASLLAAGGGQNARLFLAVGLLGGFTTFSAFSLDAVSMWQRGETGALILYVGGSVGGAIAALIAGLAAGRAIAAG